MNDREYRDYLHIRYGLPRRILDDIPGQVIVFAHASRAAAEAYADGDRRYYDHPATVQLREAVGWVSVVDLRPAIARIENGEW